MCFNISQWNKRFLASTRGQIIVLLRGSKRTVNELAQSLEVTDNAVRAHLATLERDGLVQHSGLRPGLRKPHHDYELTAEAEQLFPKSLGVILNQLLSVLGDRLSREESESILREVAVRLAAGPAEEARPLNLEQRTQAVVDMISGLGGLAQIEKQEDHLLIQGLSCPFASIVCQHHQICDMVQILISEIVQAPVQERCERDGEIRCYFEIKIDQKELASS